MPAWPRSVRLVAVLAAIASSSAMTPRRAVASRAGGPTSPSSGAAAAAPQAPASSPDDTADTSQLLADAAALRAAGDDARARPLLERAASLARRAGPPRDLLSALADLASVQFGVGDSAAARVTAREGLEIADGLDAHAMTGRLALLLSILDDADGDAVSARSSADRAVAAYARASLPAEQLQAELQQVRVGSVTSGEAKATLTRIAERARDIGETRLEARALHSLGDRQFNAGQLDAAYETLSRVVVLFEDLDEPVMLGTAFNSLGRVYRAHGRLAEALVMQKKALALHQQANDSFALMQSLNAVGAVSQRLGDLAGARAYTAQALALAGSSGSGRAQDVLAANYAALLLEDGQAAEAVTVLRDVIARGRDPFVSIRHLQLADALMRLGRHTEALQSAELGLASCDGGSPDQCVQAHVSRAAVRMHLGDAAASLADLNTALERLETLRARLVPADFFRQRFDQSYAALFDRAIALQTAHASAATALETAERARARALLDLLANRVGPDHAPVPGVVSTPLSLAATRTTTGGVDASRADAATVDQLIVSARRLGSTVLSYWVTDSELFIWVVTPAGHVASRRVPVLRSRLAALVRATSPTAAAPAAAPRPEALIALRGTARSGLLSTEATRTWRELYRHLIAPIATALPTAPGALLTIVPHGPLLGLSFAALQDPRDRYLLESYTLHYVPAGALLTFTEQRRRPDARTASLLAVADPVPPRRSALDVPLTRLPGARREVAAIGRLSRAGGTTSLVDREATESRVRAALEAPAVIHFATHAIVRDDDPFASYLSLGSSGTTPDADGVLSAREVYDLRLHADLVVLSACQSAAGGVSGDGVTTFARGFLSAGTASVMASMWDVADEPTPRLLPRFYDAWQRGATKAQALRAAQLHLLGELRAGRIRVSTPLGPLVIPEHPVFWSGFVLFGEPD